MGQYGFNNISLGNFVSSFSSTGFRRSLKSSLASHLNEDLQTVSQLRGVKDGAMNNPLKAYKPTGVNIVKTSTSTKESL